MADNENTGVESPPTITLPIQVNAKGLKTLTLDLDEWEIVETGTKDKNGKAVQYMTFKKSK